MENWLSKLERKFGRYAIPNLMYYIIILYAAGFVLNILNPEFYYRYLSLNAQAILNGQVWRIVTFIIQPPSSSLVFIVFALYLYYMIGQQLENAWGAFRFNLYFFPECCSMWRRRCCCMYLQACSYRCPCGI